VGALSGEPSGGRPLRIAIQIERFDAERGGAEGYAASLAKGLLALGHQVTVITSDVRRAPAGVEVRLVEVPRHPKWLRVLLHAIRSGREARVGGFDVVQALGKTLGMNVLNPHGGVESVWLERERLSHGGRLARGWWSLRRHLLPRHHVVQWIIRRQYRDPQVRRYVALSRAIREAMTRIHGVEEGRITVLPNRVDPARFRPARDAAERGELRRKLGLSEEKLVFLFVANNFRLKGLRPLLEALGRLRTAAPPFSLLVLGRGEARRWERLAARVGAGGLADFRGPVSGMEEWYRAADGFLHPTFYDASSLALPEAMASGLPALASRHDGSSEAITPGLDGLLLDEPADVGSLAESLRLFFDPAWRARIGAAARRTALRWPAPDPARAILPVYREALAGAPAPAAR
jgi:UDP-glucose:(heptosyl)LPS alpha-1,3-glucosyltransferase